MKIQLINKKLPNCYSYVHSLSTTRDLIVYYNKPSMQTIYRTKNFIPSYDYTKLKFNMATNIPSGRKIYLSDFVKFSFTNRQELIDFTDLLFELSQFNRIVGYSDMSSYHTIKNKLVYQYGWDKLKIRLTDDCTFPVFCDYMKELEETVTYRNPYTLSTWLLYEIDFKQTNRIVIIEK